jgi:ubiquinone biosynthesis accessory factor UbiK
MIDLKTIEAITERIGALLPADVGALHGEFKTNVKALLEATLTRMDLVTREEFDAQSTLLRRTREKLDLLEKQLSELESLGSSV